MNEFQEDFADDAGNKFTVFAGPRGRDRVRMGAVVGPLDYGITIKIQTIQKIIGLLTRAASAAERS